MMKPSSRIPPEIISYCDRYAEGLAELTTNREPHGGNDHTGQYIRRRTGKTGSYKWI